jgi:rhodanese-related sulfurtransferase
MKPFFLAFLTAVALSASACAAPGITPAEAKTLVKKGAPLVDVRTPDEFAAGHIEGAINIPIDELDARKGELPKDKDIVLYCRSGARSERGRTLLVGAGFTKVFNLGAMSNWK